MPAKKKGEGILASIVISAPNLVVAEFKIRNMAQSPYVQNKFSNRARETMVKAQEAGTTSRSKRIREKKDFDALFEGATHRSEKGWYGIPAPAFRNAMIDACRLVGFKMTMAKQSVFILPDGYDPDDGIPLVKLNGKPRRVDSTVRNATGVMDIRPRPHWDEWNAVLRVNYDADQFTSKDIANLVMRAGSQVGVGAGRHFSKDSFGLGWGCFEIYG